MSIGNAVGSNIFNLLFILGLSAVIAPLVVKKNTSHKEIPFSLFAAVILLVLANDYFLGDSSFNSVSRADGLILIFFFAIFLLYNLSVVRSEKGTVADAGDQKTKILKMGPTLLMIGGGLAALVLGGRWVVSSATDIALFFGLSEKLVGLTIASVGTSLPELFTSVIAARRGNSDIAIGNVVGSNIFNILWILGFAACLKPLAFNLEMNVDVWYLIFATAAMPILIYAGKKNVLGRAEGSLMLLAYLAYLSFLFIRG
jgi:cation:H+ antiporter